MPKVLPAIFSYEEMKSRFNEDNPDEPYTRRKDLESGIYALDNWVIRVDDNDKAISTVGWKEHLHILLLVECMLLNMEKV